MHPAVVRNVMLRWGSTVLWLFYPRREFGNRKESGRDERKFIGGSRDSNLAVMLFLQIYIGY